jgi:hypothetical protein
MRALLSSNDALPTDQIPLTVVLHTHTTSSSSLTLPLPPTCIYTNAICISCRQPIRLDTLSAPSPRAGAAHDEPANERIMGPQHHYPRISGLTTCSISTTSDPLMRLELPPSFVLPAILPIDHNAEFCPPGVAVTMLSTN